MSGDHWLLDALEAIGDPDILRGDWLITAAVKQGHNEKEIYGKMMHALVRHGFGMRRNPGRKDGRFKFGDKIVAVYARAHVRDEEIVTAVNETLFEEMF